MRTRFSTLILVRVFPWLWEPAWAREKGYAGPMQNHGIGFIMLRQPDGTLTLPKGHSFPHEKPHETILRLLEAQLGIEKCSVAEVEPFGKDKAASQHRNHTYHNRLICGISLTEDGWWWANRDSNYADVGKPEFVSHEKFEAEALAGNVPAEDIRILLSHTALINPALEVLFTDPN